METPYDWITMAIFAGLILIFLQRSTGEAEPGDSIWHYLPPAAGCAIANYIGNDKNGAIDNALGTVGHHILAALIIVAVLAYIFYVIQPLRHQRRP
ncbi:MAG TPA: hypothetical protein VNZ43_08885 [Sphingomonadaceae bacterium]|nr:hypothetical protein [Sphingomonadaceae bacterium]